VAFGYALRSRAYGYGFGYGFGRVFVESISYVGMQRSERRRKGCRKSREKGEKVVKGFYTGRTPGEIVMIVSAFC